MATRESTGRRDAVHPTSEAAAFLTRGVDAMRTIEDALAWALQRIEASHGAGDYWHRASELLEDARKGVEPRPDATPTVHLLHGLTDHQVLSLLEQIATVANTLRRHLRFSGATHAQSAAELVSAIEVGYLLADQIGAMADFGGEVFGDMADWLLGPMFREQSAAARAPA